MSAVLLATAYSSSRASEAPYGLAIRPVSKPYLNLPDRADGQLPAHLSDTGAFRDLAHLNPAEALIPYNINVSFWSDGAHKARWVSVPNESSSAGEKIAFSPTGEWKFPKGTVFVKHF